MVKEIALSAAAGLMMGMAFPKPGYSFLAWFGMVPFLMVLRSTAGRQAFRCGFWFGLAFYGWLFWWVTLFGYLPWAALTAITAGLTGLFAWSAAAVCRRAPGGVWLAGVPALWLLWDWARTLLGPLAFTWGGLGYSQAGWIAVLQVASLTGVWGITFLIVLFNAALANLLFCALHNSDLLRSEAYAVRPAAVHFAIVAGLVAAVCLAGLASARESLYTGGDSLRIAVIQGGIENSKLSPDYAVQFEERYPPLTLEAGCFQPHLILWPETVLPDFYRQSPRMEALVADLTRKTGSAILVGSQDVRDGEYYNTAFLVGPDGKTLGRYDKAQLVPFGEAVPLRRFLPSLESFGVPAYDLSPGPGHWPMGYRGRSFGVVICSESMFPDIAAASARLGAELLIVITNDAWFERTAAPAQHFQMAVLRAVENRRYLARCASTGISAVISPTGRILERADLYSRQVLTGTLHPRSQTTLFTRHGLAVPWFCFILLIGALFYKAWLAGGRI
ncbi:MAG: apolipoprotein N-acyltransferase [Armatimonadetes bacterium]|nr:apolipoprotein N-acyltransferase [Armatimonadota bacterium]